MSNVVMSKFEPTKEHLRHALLLYFNQNKSVAESHRLLMETYKESAPSHQTCAYWFRRFKNGDFDVNDKERSGQPKKFEDAELQALLDENSAQTLAELSDALQVTSAAVSKRLHAMGKILKEGKWVPHELRERDIERRLVTCEMLLDRYKNHSFLHRIVTGDEKWISFDNPVRKKSWVDPGQPPTSTPKPNIHDSKVMLCIWWDQRGVLYYELLECRRKPNEKRETITSERYAQQLFKLNEALKEKRPRHHKKVILQHDGARAHIGPPVKNAIEKLGWEVLAHPPYSPDLAPSDYHLFRSMQHSLAGKQFTKLEDAKKWIDDWIASKPKKFFYDGIHSLPEKWEKVIASDGGYFD